MLSNNRKLEKIKFIFTIGDPNSIGPEVLIKTIVKLSLKDILIIGNLQTIKFYLDLYNIKLHYNCIKLQYIDINFKDSILKISKLVKLNTINIIDIQSNNILKPGEATLDAAIEALKHIDISVKIISIFKNATLITLPINKSKAIEFKKNFTGVTEHLNQNNKYSSTMLMFSDNIKVALVTTHYSIKNVSKVLTRSKIKNTINNTYSFLKRMNNDNKVKLGILSLNPHCGENGLVGTEEIEIIQPVIKSLNNSSNLIITGPISADTAFTFNIGYDAYISMYHDQGIIPFKILSNYDGANITLGLPFTRISPTHGTAYNICMKNKANTNSLEYCIKLVYTLK